MKASSYYSKSTKGFYTLKANGKNIPEDAVEITDQHRLFLLEAESKGMIISVDASGQPIAVDRPAPTTAQLNEQVAAKRRAAYQLESDPLFFMAQCGEATTADFIAKRAEIKLRYPKAK